MLLVLKRNCKGTQTHRIRVNSVLGFNLTKGIANPSY